MKCGQVFTLTRRTGKASKRSARIAWPLETAWACMSTNGDTVHLESIEWHMPLSYYEFTSRATNCNRGDFYQAKHNMSGLNYLHWIPRYITNSVSAIQMFHDFIAFCRKYVLRKALIKGGKDEVERTRAWFKVADTSYEVRLFLSPDSQTLPRSGA